MKELKFGLVEVVHEWAKGTVRLTKVGGRLFEPGDCSSLLLASPTKSLGFGRSEDTVVVVDTFVLIVSCL